MSIKKNSLTALEALYSKQVYLDGCQSIVTLLLLSLS